MSKEFSADEVAQHNKEGNAYIIIEDGVYDISKFAALHPGGKGVILGVAGQDATEQFWQFHNKAILKKYEKRLRIGTVAGKAKKEAPKAQSTGEQAKKQEAAQQINQQAKQQSKQQSSTPASLEDRVFGDLTPYGDPSWYQGWHSPYYNDSHRKWRKFLRDFVQEHLDGNVHAWDEAKKIPDSIRKKCGEAGLLAAAVEEGFKFTDIKPGYGVIEASEYDAFHGLIFQEELGKLGSAGFTWGLTGGLSIGLPPVLRFFKNNQPLAKKIARECLSGEKAICLAITEPSAGSDVANLATTAKKSEDGKYYIVNGNKKWITNGVTADYFTTAVRTGGAAHGGVSLLLIERSEGVTTKQMQCQGVWSSGTTYVEFNNVKVPVENLIGKENQGFKYVMLNFNPERMGSATGATVFSRVLVEESMKYAFKRKTFGKRLIDHPVIRLKLAHMARQVESLHAWIENITYQVNTMSHAEASMKLGGPIALVKGHASIVMEYCAREAAQIFGGLAYTRGGQGEKVERLYREVRAYAIPAGSEEIMFDLAIRQSMKQYQAAQKMQSKH